MKIQEIVEGETTGSYAGVRFGDLTKDAICDYIKENNIPNAVPQDKLHTTLLYSKKYLPNYKPAGMYKKLIVGEPTEFEVWPSQPDDDGNISKCLVLRYRCPELVDRHKYLMKQHNAQYDFDEYKPHITFSYDVGDLKPEDLPAFTTPILIVSEYGEDLNTNWNDQNE